MLRKSAFRVSAQVRHKMVCTTTENSERVEISDLGSRGCELYVAKAKALISCLATMQLVCAFVFAYVKSRFSHDVAQLLLVLHKIVSCSLY